jgi:hypothetical protein
MDTHAPFDPLRPAARYQQPNTTSRMVLRRPGLTGRDDGAAAGALGGGLLPIRAAQRWGAAIPTLVEKDRLAASARTS